MNLFKNIKKYMPYARATAWAELKSQVAESYLGWLWWILDPLLFMMVYTFIVEVVFNTTVENFPIYVFIGLILWNLFASTVTSSVGIIRSYRAVFLQTYIPKYMLIMVQLMVNLIKMMIGLGVSFVIILIVGINITVNIFSLVPILIVYVLLTFGVSLFCAHAGVFVADLKNVITVLIRLLFYLSGVFFSLIAYLKVLFTYILLFVPQGLSSLSVGMC